MTTKISTVYDAIVTKITALYPTKQRLFNPYTLTENPDLTRKDSWGFKVDSATRQDLEYCNLSVSRSFTFYLMRQFVTLAGKEDGFDNISKLLLEDQQTFLSSFYSPDQIDQEQDIESIEFSDISGLQLLEDGEKKQVTRYKLKLLDRDEPDLQLPEKDLPQQVQGQLPDCRALDQEGGSAHLQQDHHRLRH